FSSRTGSGRKSSTGRSDAASGGRLPAGEFLPRSTLSIPALAPPDLPRIATALPVVLRETAAYPLHDGTIVVNRCNPVTRLDHRSARAGVSIPRHAHTTPQPGSPPFESAAPFRRRTGRGGAAGAAGRRPANGGTPGLRLIELADPPYSRTGLLGKVIR